MKALSWDAEALADRPDVWRELAADRTLLPSATEEILRWASSTTYNRRTATADTEVAGVPIAAGDKVTLWWGSANYDERAFPEPFRFDVRRDPNRHLAFGHGSHFCLGAHLARLEIRLVLDVLLDRVERFEPLGPIERARVERRLLEASSSKMTLGALHIREHVSDRLARQPVREL